METEPKNYEIAYLISPQVAAEDAFGEAGKITGFIQDAKGFIGHIEEPKRKTLAYSIKKFREAYFGWTRFSIGSRELSELEKKLSREPNIIRFLIVHADETPPERYPLRHGAARKTQKSAVPPAEKERMDIGELDKRLEEILGK